MKARKPFLLNSHGKITTTSPNLQELRQMHRSLMGLSTPVASGIASTPVASGVADERLQANEPLPGEQ